MGYVQAAIAILLLVIMAIFCFQNLESVDVSFLVWAMKMPKIVMILSSFVLGMFSGWGLVELLKRVF